MRLYTFLFLLLLSSSIIAQKGKPKGAETDLQVTGKIIDQESGNPLEFATVAFINQGGVIVTGGITNSKGAYKIDVPSGTYTVQFEFISYETKQLSGRSITGNTQLPTIRLALDPESLDEVIVRAETTEVQIRLDKKVYNIGKDLTTSGATVSDALNNVPSVTVDVDGTINLRGNENVRILINGKPSAIAGFGSTEALRQLPAEAIEKVEVITSPSARYDAEGTAGILNIILKKEKTLGFNGSLQSYVGYPWATGVTANVNLRTNKFNLFNTTGVRYTEFPGNAFFENRFSSPDVENPLVVEDRDFDRLRKGINTNLGIEYFLTETSSVTAAAFYRVSDNETTNTNITDEFGRDMNLAVSRTRIEEELEDDTNVQLSFNYTNNFNTDGHMLTADFQWEKGEQTEASIIGESNTFPGIEVLPSEDIITKEDETEYLIQADYVLPIGENGQFEAGFRGRYENKVTDYLLKEQLVVNGPFVRNDSLSNVFDFTQNVFAVYSQYGNKIGDFSFLLGLRMESTVLKGDVTGEDVTTNDDFNVSFDKDFLGLFPTVNLVYELNEKENFTLGYNRRINRPRHWYLNPFPSRSSEANIFQGNPGLDPAYSSAFDLGYLKRWDKLTFTSSVYYQYETDSFERVQEDTGQETPNGIPIIRTIPINLSTNERIGFEAGVLYNPAKWLRVNSSFNFFQFKTEGEFNGVDYGAKNNSWFTRFSTKVSLPAKIEWQTNAFYRGRSVNAQTERKGIFSLNLAFSKDIFNDNATIGANVNDLLNSRKRQSLTETTNFVSDSEFQWRERSFRLTFTYRFNEKKKRNGRENRGFEDEGGYGG